MKKENGTSISEKIFFGSLVSIFFITWAPLPAEWNGAVIITFIIALLIMFISGFATLANWSWHSIENRLGFIEMLEGNSSQSEEE